MRTSPRQFLKTRRPEQFSDSDFAEETTIDRLKLEEYFSTLTNRSQELEFEGFAKSLCQVEICPNLLPHTGPTAGGDSKVDSETYPVSDTTSLAWFVGVGDKAASERWGFAFSIRKDWKTKLKDDVRKIHATERGYKVAYFVSSQYIPDKERAEAEDELRDETGIDVRVLDRNWILDKVLKNRRHDIVAKELHVEVLEEIKPRKGPFDTKKETQLEELDKKIVEDISKEVINNSTIEDSIRSAILSREIEKPRVEIDGRFERAKRLANEHGTSFHQFNALYQHAWTTFWWLEDFSTYQGLYKQVEEKALKSDNVYDLERLVNLWYCLNTVRNQEEDKEKISTNEEFFSTATKNLKKKLTKLSKNTEHKPSASLYAKSLFLHVELAEKRFSGGNIDKVLAELKEVVQNSQNLIGFPLKSTTQVLTEISPVLEDSPVYKDLFETILEVIGKRDGELASAKLLLDRGEKLIELDKPHEAIQSIGSALRLLYKNESKDDVVRALFLIGGSYEMVGLFWAARGALLTAASLATSDIWNYGDINTMQAACYKHLKWLELRLGRLPQALDWNELDLFIRNLLVNKGLKQEDVFEQITQFDVALGVIFLHSDLETLGRLEQLPSQLEKQGLDFSPIALLHALGHTDKLPRDFTSVIKQEDMDDFFTQWANLYTPTYLPEKLTNTEEDVVTLTSHILGCEIMVKTENQPPCLEVAESVLASTESFLSTGTLLHAAAHESNIEINIDRNAKSKMIEFEIIDDEDKPIVNIHCGDFNPHSMSHSEQGKLRDHMFELVVETMARFVIFEDHKKDLKEIMGKERAADRAFGFSSSFVTLGNVLGHTPKTRITDWIDKEQVSYELLRTEPLEFPETSKSKDDSDTPPDKDALAHAKHTDMQTVSIIRNALWDKAGWTGAGYVVMPGGEAPPILTVLFKHVEVGKKIFEGWKKKFGSKDIDEEIRVTIVTGVDQDNPSHYKVGIGSNIKALEKEHDRISSRFFMAITRIHTMTPTSHENLNNFKESFGKFGIYLLAPGSLGNPPQVFIRHGIVKREVIFKEAWEIGPNDLDMLLISPEDKPVIPPEVKNPPILELLKSREDPDARPRKIEK